MKVSCASIIIDSRGSISRIGRQASPSAKATGTRTISSATNTPNRTSAACPAESTAAAHRAAPEQDPRFVDDLLAREHDPGEACHRPGDVNQPERQVGQFRRPVPGKPRELDPGPHEHQRQRQDAEARHDPHRGLRPPRQVGPDVDLEMLRFPDADHRADHDRPDEQEARHLLGPDVGRDQRGVARDDLQRDGNDQDADAGRQQDFQQLGIAGRHSTPQRRVGR